MERLRAQDKDTINKQNQTLADYESELSMLRRRVNGLEQDLGYEKGENKRLHEELFKTVQERDMERLNNIDLQNQLQALQEEMEFLKNVSISVLRSNWTYLLKYLPKYLSKYLPKYLPK